MPECIRVLFLADSHLGFDLPAQPRVARRRRGHDFLANFAAALEPARRGEVDLVVHGGDVFDRPCVLPSLAYQAFEPLLRVAAAGVPVFVVPGNHERSRLPHARLAAHPLLHVFDRARTFRLRVRGLTVGVSGFPFERRGVRDRFPELLEHTGWRAEAAAVRLLCMHQCLEGATVGPGNYTFRNAADVVRGGDVPAGLDAVLSGHIHRHQVLTRDLQRRPLPAPVLYPGSIERTSLAEIGEPKGYLVLRLPADPGARRLQWEFRRLPARPMIVEQLQAGPGGPAALERALAAIIATAPADAVLRIRLLGIPTGAEVQVLTAARLRALAPDSMNVEVITDQRPFRPPERAQPDRTPRSQRRRAGAAQGLLPI